MDSQPQSREEGARTDSPPDVSVPTPPFHVFQCYGVELEYVLVDRETLEVRPIADRVLAALAGSITSDAVVGQMAWSNELVLHLLELKTNGPVPTLENLTVRFQDAIRDVQSVLATLRARLMPSGMHPWMNPEREVKLWPHEYSAIYQSFDRIFQCQQHGWANVQSVHLNLPFAGDDEFARLHTAIRLILPVLPALAASSPVVEGELTGYLDNRLHAYCDHARRIPSVMGHVIPEAVFTFDEYQRRILEPMYRDIAPLDSEGVLQDEFLNARGAIARFVRSSIEIRLLDVQETPRADLAICDLVSRAVQMLVSERWTGMAEQAEHSEESLAQLLDATIRNAEQTSLNNAAYLRQFGLNVDRCTAGELWQHLAIVCGVRPCYDTALQAILNDGPLARRLIRALGTAPSRQRLRAVYGRLCECLLEGELFRA